MENESTMRECLRLLNLPGHPYRAKLRGRDLGLGRGEQIVSAAVETTGLRLGRTSGNDVVVSDFIKFELQSDGTIVVWGMRDGSERQRVQLVPEALTEELTQELDHSFKLLGRPNLQEIARRQTAQEQCRELLVGITDVTLLDLADGTAKIEVVTANGKRTVINLPISQLAP
ncbi:MAG TPA: hypothetical protein VD907_01765 [Verrucomicrobiae bacterium]|nr:hypothetical protein [Verrucomicrobiae bacterium]